MCQIADLKSVLGDNELHATSFDVDMRCRVLSNTLMECMAINLYEV